MSISDESLARDARQGNRASFEALLRRWQVPLLHFLRQRAASHEDAEDLTQETFVRAYRNLDRYDPRRRFSTWLFTIGHRLAINHRRQQANGRPGTVPQDWLAPDLASFPTDDPEPADRMSAAESRGRLWHQAAAELSDVSFTAVWLFYVEQLPTREIALVLGHSRTSVKTMLCRARKKLQATLAEEFSAEVWEFASAGELHEPLTCIA